jgi:hypothetical protein
MRLLDSGSKQEKILYEETMKELFVLVHILSSKPAFDPEDYAHHAVDLAKKVKTGQYTVLQALKLALKPTLIYREEGSALRGVQGPKTFIQLAEPIVDAFYKGWNKEAKDYGE